MFDNKIKFFICLLITTSYLTPVIALSLQERNVQKKQVVSDSQKPDKPSAQTNTTHSQTKGIILRLHKWPTQEEEKTIIDQVQQLNLKIKPEKFKRFKMLVFEWKDENKPAKDATAVCEKFLNLSLVKYCEPDHKAIFP